MNREIRILVVDDEIAMRESLAGWLTKEGYQVLTAGSGPEALARLAEQPCRLLLLDIKMPGMDGLELLQRVKAAHPESLVIMITAYGSIESAVEAMKQGASDYLLKPFDPEQMLFVIERLLKQQALAEENLLLKERLAEREGTLFEDLVSSSPAMHPVFRLIDDVAPTDTPVLITGETGTGKELVARAIHARSSRAFGPFVTINCGALAENLLESELFGHERGAFTGAVKARRGRLEMADGGTFFLDEVGEIPLKMQVDLLRVLEERRFQRVGGSASLTSDFRLICATHQDLPELIRQGRFRPDFYYRINVITISIPPLRERAEDLQTLARHFLDRYAREMNKPVKSLTPEAQRLLSAYAWPGNVRELKNVMERAVVVCRSVSVGASELVFLRTGDTEEPKGLTLKEVERAHLRRVLAISDWNISQTAKVLHIDRSTLMRKIKQFDLKKNPAAEQG
ncbi:MAG: sigma-54-dependent Fis family transcriptional regulator [Deltaproteobacteria bacterium]|nr:sigma-54-dependent Fis family transcriptional regulator [Deltaproteobacteria bacterium]